MPKLESNITKQILLAVSKSGARLFRNNVAMAWVGQQLHSAPGTVTLRDARPLHAGLCPGSSDLIGWTVREITPDMVGKKVAVFTAIEVKAERGRASAEQVNFIEQVRLNGGIAGIARSHEDALNLIQNQPTL